MMQGSLNAGVRWGVYAFTSFWGAYLLFQLEPLIGKFILPWFGGSPAVWITCMLFFQVLLLAGYAYAHLNLEHFPVRRQGVLHAAFLLLALFTLPVTPEQSFKPDSSEQPTLNILLLLLSSIGLPFFILSTTSPLLQAWIVRINPYRSPYTLYALSNFGSLLALLSYPFVFEPYFKLGQQTLGWSAGFVIYVLLSAGIALDFRRLAKAEAIVATPMALDDETRIADRLSPTMLWLLWLVLPAATSALLLAVTNQLCQDVASVPFLWIVPLSLYVISFIFCFARHDWYQRRIFIPALFVAAIALIGVLYGGGRFTLEAQVGIYGAGLFFCCMTCHGELYRLRPQPSQLTAYYLVISTGGALGGIFVALLAPQVFPLYFEFHIALFACCLLTLFAIGVESQLLERKRRRPLVWLLAGAGLIWLGGNLANHAFQTAAEKTRVNRNFYGVLRVEDRAVENPTLAKRLLRHGAIDHGFQFLAPEKQQLPTAYYGNESGVGLALTHFARADGRRIGVVGLGTGTLLTYGKANDYFRIYDIDPAVVELAQTYFSYIKNTAARYDIVVSDARLAMEREAPQAFDILVLDAFSGDAIPMHLLTEQALQLYLRHLRPDGVLAIHITNHYLDLRPLVSGMAKRAGYAYLLVQSEPSEELGWYRADWALLSKNQSFMQQPVLQKFKEMSAAPVESIIWTDDFSNMFRLLK
ncbi:fused MFS/spermidine synthase [Methylomonas rapida]|uniref:Fused MFS/spermidine synthase n=1 Tax=Methylomonas rapida TaxID=2963939 RepID=A0ABY7GIV7_9GAMM|nr:fused MFS/spermidine synthase [Methylomonas rapida]WAR44279.1 fused MFS/spermidine synthase [Methylomonas rapida]